MMKSELFTIKKTMIVKDYYNEDEGKKKKKKLAK